MLTDPQPRLPFSEELTQRVAAFVRETLAAIPELESLAVIPGWPAPQPELPRGYLRGQNGPLAHPGEIMHLALQLHAVLHDVLGLSLESLRIIDAEMQRVAIQIREQQHVHAPTNDRAANPPV